MKLTIKTLDQKTFYVDFDEAQSVWDLKSHLHTLPEIGVRPELQQLIYAGRVLENDNSLKSYDVDERKFLVVMAKKAPPVSLPVKSEATAETTKPADVPKVTGDASNTDAAGKGKSEVVATTAASAAEEKSTAPAGGTATNILTTTAATAGTGTTTTLATTEVTSATTTQPQEQQGRNVLQAMDFSPTAAASESMVQQIMGMGYGEYEVRRALLASFNNPDRAIEYLIEGIPEITEATPEQPGNPIADLGLSGGGVGGGGGGVAGLLSTGSGGGGGGTGTGAIQTDSGGMADNPLSFLRQDPRFMQMRRVIRQRPELLSSVLARIGETNPALLDIIREHQSEFVTMLNEGEQQPAAEDTLQDASEVREVLLTEEDNNVIDRLVALGFPRQIVLQAYIACERNEEQTADFLCRHMEE